MATLITVVNDSYDVTIFTSISKLAKYLEQHNCTVDVSSENETELFEKVQYKNLKKVIKDGRTSFSVYQSDDDYTEGVADWFCKIQVHSLSKTDSEETEQAS